MVTGAKGKQRRIYRWYATPLEILRQLPDLARYLKREMTEEVMNQRAGNESDTSSARRMQKEKQKLFAPATTAGKSGNPKQDSHFPIAAFHSLKKLKKGGNP